MCTSHVFEHLVHQALSAAAHLQWAAHGIPHHSLAHSVDILRSAPRDEHELTHPASDDQSVCLDYLSAALRRLPTQPFLDRNVRDAEAFFVDQFPRIPAAIQDQLLLLAEAELTSTR